MATLAELAERSELTPSEMKRFGRRVTYFSMPEKYKPKNSGSAKQALFKKIEAFVKKTGGQLYTGIHSENDWTRTRWWSKGAHLVNRTLEFVVLVY